MSGKKTDGRLALGVVGGALSSAVGYAHFAATHMDGRFRFAAGCFSKSWEQNQESGARFGVDPKRIYTDYQSLIEGEAQSLDAVIILTPTPSHAHIVGACLKSGIPVVCEKALCGTVEDAEALLNMVRLENGYLAITYNYSGYPMVRELRRRVRDGALGKILQIRAQMPQESFVRRSPEGAPMNPQAWRVQDGTIPTLHLDLGVHLHQLVFYLTGWKPREVIAEETSMGAFDTVIDNVEATARYDHDVPVHFWFSKAALGYRNGFSIQIFGERASAEWVQGAPEVLTLSHANGRREIVDRGGYAPAAADQLNRFKAGHPAGYIEAFANLYSDIADDLHAYNAGQQERSQEVFGAQLAVEGLHFLQAMTRSAKARAWQSVEGQSHQPSERSTAAA